MNPKVMARQARLLRMLESKEEIRVGRERDCPLPVAQLVKLKDSHPSVIKVYRHGLTAEVFHLKIDGHHWCLKRRRNDSLVANLDGKTAFLTELERRREIEALRELHPTVLSHVVCTSFGSARAGILVNLVMWAFNLFPLPPLDGGRILVGLLPTRAALLLSRVEPFGFFIVLALVLLGIVGSLWLRPLMDMGYTVIDWIITPLLALLR